MDLNVHILQFESMPMDLNAVIMRKESIHKYDRRLPLEDKVNEYWIFDMAWLLHGLGDAATLFSSRKDRLFFEICDIWVQRHRLFFVFELNWVHLLAS